MATIFTAISSGRGQEIWVSHGTASSTFMLKDVRPGATGSAPLLLGNLVVGGSADPNRLIFTANDGSNGNELWVTDGTAAGTVLFKDINPGAGGSFASAWVNLGTSAVFTATDATNGTELWVSNGTAAGTVLLANLNPGAADATPIHLGPLQVAGVADATRAMFVLNDGTNGREIWVTDGTVAGTTLLKDINPAGSSNPTPWTSVNGHAVFTANDGTQGTELWVSDGTGASTLLLKDAAPGAAGSDPEVLGYLLEAGIPNLNKLLVALDDVTNGRELWVTDGTTAGTVLFKDLDSGSPGSSPGAWTAVNGRAVFAATTAAAGSELWVSDGTAAGTVLLLDANAGAANAAPELLGNLVVGGVSDPNRLLVRMNNGTNGTELWVTDGTPGGTALFKDINPGTGDSGASAWDVVNGRAIFAADDGANGRELWVSDGTAAGTVMLVDARPGSVGSNPTPVGYLTVNGVPDSTRMLFLMDDGSTGQELWVTDGTAGGTALFKDANAGAAGSFATAGQEIGGSTADFSAAPAGVTMALGAGGSASNAVGSAFADTLTGNAGVNQLDGGPGDDILTGGLDNDVLFGGPDFDLGNDTAVFSGSRAESEIRFDLATGLYTVLGPDGADLLKNINNLQFNDRTVDIRGSDTLPRHLVNVSFPQPGGGSIDRFMIGSPYSGPVIGLTDEFVFPTTENINIASTLPNSFLRTGAGNDAITVFSGRNVIDSFTGSNFITCGSGQDTVFVDGRGGGVTWDTIVNFGVGDEVTLWGYVDGISTDGLDPNTWYASDGTPGFTGLTIHARLGGTTIDASITFAGMASEDRANMFVSTGNVAGNDYLYITRLA